MFAKKSLSYVTPDASDFSNDFQLKFVIPGHFCLYLLLIPLPRSQICETLKNVWQQIQVGEDNTSAWIVSETTILIPLSGSQICETFF